MITVGNVHVDILTQMTGNQKMIGTINNICVQPHFMCYVAN